MTYDQFNTFCGTLAATSYVVQWGGAHVWKVGGKLFAVGGWEKLECPAFVFKVSEADFFFLQDVPGFRPAPYMAARGMKWIQQYDTNELHDEQLKELIEESHCIVSLGLTKKNNASLDSTKIKHELIGE